MTTYTTQHEADLATLDATIQAYYENVGGDGMVIVTICWPDGAYHEARFDISEILSDWEYTEAGN